MYLRAFVCGCVGVRARILLFMFAFSILSVPQASLTDTQ